LVFEYKSVAPPNTGIGSAGNYVTLFSDCNFDGNALSSLIVPPGYRVVLNEFENFGGRSYTITASKSMFTLSGWNDKASSIAVYRDR